MIKIMILAGCAFFVGWVLLIWILRIIIWILSVFGAKPSSPVIKETVEGKDLGKGATADLLDETDDYIAQQEFESKSGISKLVSEADKYYRPDLKSVDHKKAFDLFKKIIELAPDAPKSLSKQKAIQLNEVGFSCWAAFVCYESNLPVEDEADKTYWNDSNFELLINLIRKKSPGTAAEIVKRLKESEVDRAFFDDLGKREEEFVSILRQKEGGFHEIRAMLKTLTELYESKKLWWRARDFANALVEGDLNHDSAWALYNSALLMRAKMGADLSTIYEPMGHMRKKEGNYFDAGRLYLMAYAQTPKQGNEEQIRICLKKYGLGEDAERIKGLLVSVAKSKGLEAAVDAFSSLVKKAELRRE